LFRLRLVVNHYGRFGAAFVKTDLDHANYETTITDQMAGELVIRCA
jgi:hypothetical protein